MQQKVKISSVAGLLAVDAEVFNLDFDGSKMKVFIANGSNHLSHFKTGRRISRLPIADLARYENKQVAQWKLDALVKTMGKDVMQETIAKFKEVN